MIPALKLVDGYYFGVAFVGEDEGTSLALQHAEHSWLTTPDNTIIDAYPVGFIAVNPIMVVTKGKYAPNGGNFYLRDPTVTKEVAGRELWKKTQHLVTLAKGWKP